MKRGIIHYFNSNFQFKNTKLNFSASKSHINEVRKFYDEGKLNLSNITE